MQSVCEHVLYLIGLILIGAAPSPSDEVALWNTDHLIDPKFGRLIHEPLTIDCFHDLEIFPSASDVSGLLLTIQPGGRVNLSTDWV